MVLLRGCGVKRALGVEHVFEGGSATDGEVGHVALMETISSPTHQTLRLAVVDRGIGIASEDLPLIFNPFFRADRSRARHSGGSASG